MRPIFGRRVAVGARGPLRDDRGHQADRSDQFRLWQVRVWDPIRSDCAREPTATAWCGDIIGRSVPALLPLIRPKGIARISPALEITPVEIVQERHAGERLQLALLAADVGNYSHQY